MPGATAASQTTMSLLIYPDPRLRQQTRPLPEEMGREEFERIQSGMFDTMYAHAGQGLAANQVGLSWSVFVAGAAGKAWTFINPQALEYDKRTATQQEGCLSLPGVRADVTRPYKVKLKYFASYDDWKRGKYTTQQYAGPMGRVVQHELDHLRGMLIIDKLSEEDLEKLQPVLQTLPK